MYWMEEMMDEWDDNDDDTIVMVTEMVMGRVMDMLLTVTLLTNTL
jgi:hypothetical protein